MASMEPKRDGTRVWIERVPEERRVEGIWHMDGLPASLRSALEYRGAEEKYLDDTVFAALTGQPFRFWFSSDWASCLAYTFEAPVGVIVAEALGYDYAWYWEGGARPDPREQDRELIEKLWEVLKGQIDGGNPVILFGGEEPPDEKADPVLVTGYDTHRSLVFFVPHVTWRPAPVRDESSQECREGIGSEQYRARRRPDETNWFGNSFANGGGMGAASGCLFALRNRKRAPSEREVVLAVLRRAVGLGRGTLYDAREPQRKSGLEAFDLLIQCLEDDARDEAYWRRVGEGDWWFAMECLTAGGFRKAASAFLRKCADGFGELNDEARSHLADAADAYQESGANMGKFIALLETVGSLADYDGRTRTVAQALATPHLRRQAADLMRNVRAAEQLAADEMEKALAADLRHRLASVDLSGRGTGFERDSFCLAIQEAARVLGKKIEYETLLALTTNAFAPGFDTGNHCKELWVANAWVSHFGPLDNTWAHLGLSVEPLAFLQAEGEPDEEDAREVKQIREAMAQGKVVVACGGWEHRKGRWVEPWWAGIVTDVTEEGVVLGAHLNGRKDNELVDFPQDEFLAVSLAEPSLGVKEMNASLLRAAVARVRAQGEHFKKTEFTAFGLDAMDEWIGQMTREPHFCPACREKKGEGWQSAFTVARAALHRSQVAAHFLRERLTSFPKPAGPYVERAAEHYEAIVTLLRPATSGEGEDHYRAFIGDLDKQKEHAEKVLIPVKNELTKAADEIEKAVEVLS